MKGKQHSYLKFHRMRKKIFDILLENSLVGQPKSGVNIWGKALLLIAPMATAMRKTDHIRSGQGLEVTNTNTKECVPSSETRLSHDILFLPL